MTEDYNFYVEQAIGEKGVRHFAKFNYKDIKLSQLIKKSDYERLKDITSAVMWWNCPR